jgi:molybdate transport system ATP-binding protein
MTLLAEVGLRRGELELDVTLTAGDGEVVALLGPNGSGKTSMLRAVAGLEPLLRGRVVVGDEVMDDPAGDVFVPVEERPIGLVFQNYLLFPHLSVRDNVAFGLRSQGMSKQAAGRVAMEWLERLGLGDKAKQRPTALSGGEQQRVALARVLAPQPKVLLLDEPLAALDVATRREVRAELIAHLEDFPGARVLVTHDPVEAVVMADRIVVLEGGKVSQEGTAAEIRMRPRSDYIARLVGVNLLRGTAADHHIALPGGVEVHLAEVAPQGEVFALVRPQAVALFRERPEGTPRNVWRLRVLGIEGEAERVRVELGGPIGLVAEVTPGAVTALDLVPGTEVWAAVKATDIEVYPA